jgi:hypothetical protein
MGIQLYTSSARAKRNRAEIGVLGKTVILGMFHTISEAVTARREGERIYWAKG